MARAESKMIMGYLPIEERHYPALLSLVAPATPAVKLLDPLAREGAFLDTAAALGDIIAEGLMALAVVAADPPMIPEAPKAEPKPVAPRKTTAKASAAPSEAGERTIDIPLRKGVRKVGASLLPLPDDAAERATVLALAGRLVLDAG